MIVSIESRVPTGSGYHGKPGKTVVFFPVGEISGNLTIVSNIEENSDQILSVRNCGIPEKMFFPFYF